VKQARVRVASRGEGGDIYDFNTGTQHHYRTLPNWMQTSIALINIAGVQVDVTDVGIFWGEDVYYLTIKGDLGEGAADE
jgi:hypothetical protein